MMNSSVHSATSGSRNANHLPSADDNTVVTPTRGEKAKSNEGKRVETTLKFRFVPSQDNDNVHPAILHAHWMNEVKSLFGDKVQFLDNRNCLVGKLDPLKTDPEIHSQKFLIQYDRHITQQQDFQRNKPDYCRVTNFIVHRIRTSVSLREIKASPQVFKLMQGHDFYVNEHRWSETDWETTQLGFLNGIDPQFHDIDQATNQVTKLLQQNLSRIKLPKFRLVFCSPKIKTQKGHIARTKACTIETLRADRDKMNKYLKTAYKDNGSFVRFQMRARHPEAFERFIKAQTQMIAKNNVIILNHIGVDAMHCLSDCIVAIPGILALLPTASVNEDGKYKVLVHQKDYHQVRNFLKDILPKWYDEHLEPDAKAPEYCYPGPPEVSPIQSDRLKAIRPT